MQVIAGQAKGRKLRAPSGLTTRPTPSRVREALFSILGERIVDARVLDLFAGSGALGIEALSRGAGHVTFVEHDRRALEALRRNTAFFPPERLEILATKGEQALALLARRRAAFDIVLIDPPFEAGLWAPVVRSLIDNRLLAADALVVCEHPKQVELPPLDLSVVKTRRYGDVMLTLLEAPCP